MAKLLHEIWEEQNEGQCLHTCCFAGPRGDGCRQTLSPDAKLVTTFEASSHFEAMTIYYQLLQRGIYTTDHAWDIESYPDEWFEEQQNAVQK